MNRSFRLISTRWNEKAFKLPPVNNLFFLFYKDNIASIKIVWENRGEKNKIPDNVFIFIFACVFLIFSHLSVFSRGWCLHEYSFTFQFVCSFQTLHFVRVSVFWSQPWQSVSRVAFSEETFTSSAILLGFWSLLLSTGQPFRAPQPWDKGRQKGRMVWNFVTN